ncbi:MAG: ACT domain-containing protein [Candidatus Omnitrophota bacterium]|nr:ACT domain-containing protein [Candidatus Omnitrophota bacterium]
MIKSLKKGKEIVVTAANKVGILATISKILADHAINIEGVAGYAVNKEAKIMLVTNDTPRAKKALQEGGYKKIKENDVVVVELENKPGALKDLSAKLAGGKIDIKYTYGTTCIESCPSRIIFSTSNNEKAIVILKA